MFDLEKAIDGYYNYLRSKTIIGKGEIYKNYGIITMPFFVNYNDYLVIYCLEKENDKIILSDDGQTYENFRCNNDPLKTPFSCNYQGFGVELSEDNELFLETTKERFSEDLKNIIDCILYLSK